VLREEGRDRDAAQADRKPDRSGDNLWAHRRGCAYASSENQSRALYPRIGPPAAEFNGAAAGRGRRQHRPGLGSGGLTEHRLNLLARQRHVVRDHEDRCESPGQGSNDERDDVQPVLLRFDLVERDLGVPHVCRIQ
jgi:hypothetical protein